MDDDTPHHRDGEENPAIHGSETGPDEPRDVTDADDATDDDATDTDDDVRTTPTLADQGKDVVDADGEDLGIVSDVDGDILYVEPDPGPIERLKSVLHWRGGESDELQVPAERVRRIDDEVVLDLGDGGEGIGDRPAR